MTIAQITRPRGVRGEVVAVSLTNFPERFAQLGEVRIATSEQVFWETLESYRFHQNSVFLKFVGLNRRHEVEYLVGGQVQVPQAERVIPPSDTYFHSDLIGCEVLNREELLGTVEKILENSAAALLLVEAEEGEILIPLAKVFLRRVDLTERRIEVDLPEDLVRLNQTQISSNKRRKKKQGSTRKKRSSKRS